MRVALVDMDDTLVDYRWEENLARDTVWAQHLPHMERDAWRIHYRRAKVEARMVYPLPCAEGYTDRLRRALWHAVPASAPPDERLVQACERTYWQCRYASVTPLPGARELLDALRAPYDKLLLCTMGATDVQTRRAARVGIGSAFDAICTSEAAGVGKDEWPAFLGGHWRGAYSYLMVSDTCDPDLRSAARQGMRTAWLRRPGSGSQPSALAHGFRADCAADNLPDLTEAILALAPC
ncbi:HAD family hydrolase [Streptomyces sp. NPDC053474]|uniref:HAD family hydrolase n=1 Tax=Streptomyces sp. NPDC053474 TaxID=3365704 RepID=UPI0037D88F82